MKYGVHYGYWAQEWDADVPALCQRAQRTGLQILEIGAACIQNKTEAELAAIRDAADRCGVELSCGMGLPVDRNIADRDPAVRSAGVQYMQEMIRRAAGAGIHKIAGILYASWFYDAKKPVYKEETRAYSIENMQQLAEYAKQYGIVLMMEVCNRFATYMLNTAAEASEYVRAVGQDNVKVMLDTFHMNIEEDHFADAIRTAGSGLGYIHICESNRKLPGQGHLPWPEILGVLREIRFDGPAVCECFVNMRGAIAHDLKTWRELRPDYSETGKDQDLMHSIRYLKELQNQ